MARLLEKYKNEIIGQLKQDLSFKNTMRVPCLEKIVVNMGVGKAINDQKILDEAAEELAVITGQRPLKTKAKKSVAAFKLREGVPIGAKVTLRGKRMYEFLDRFISVVVPRIRDFRGFPDKQFDKKGNYSFGISEQTVFPELNLDKIKRVQGMGFTIVTSAHNEKEAKALLDRIGFPFSKRGE